MKFAKWVFLLAGVLGVLIVAPLYWEGRFFRDFPPAINRPEFYYGFVGVTLAWQVLFLVIASDPARYRRAMLPAVLEKAGFAAAIPLLYAAGRGAAVWIGFASVTTHLILRQAGCPRLPRRADPASGESQQFPGITPGLAAGDGPGKLELHGGEDRPGHGTPGPAAHPGHANPYRHTSSSLGSRPPPGRWLPQVPL